FLCDCCKGLAGAGVCCLLAGAALPAPDCGIDGGIGAIVWPISAHDPMHSQNPLVAGLADLRTTARPWPILGIVTATTLTGVIENDVDRANVESGQLDLEVKVQQPLQLICQGVLVPACQFGEPVIGEQIAALFCCREMTDPERRHFIQAKEFCSFQPSVTCNDFAVLVHENWIDEPKPPNTIGNLPDLFARVHARIGLARFELIDRDHFDAAVKVIGSARAFGSAALCACDSDFAGAPLSICKLHFLSPQTSSTGTIPSISGGGYGFSVSSHYPRKNLPIRSAGN